MRKYIIDGYRIDSFELKVLIVTNGIRVNNRIYRELDKCNRIYPNPLKCNCIILPDDTVVQLTDLTPHLKYIKNALSWDIFKQMKYFSQMKTDFTLELLESGEPALYYKGELVTKVKLPKASDFYNRKTKTGLPYMGNAVLQGTEWLSFQCLWICEYACVGEQCQFCYSGGVFRNITKKKKRLPAFPTPDDVAEIVNYTLNNEKTVNSIQITGGSTFDSEKECNIIMEYLDAINEKVGIEKITGELLLYITPPEYPEAVDRFFEAGVDRIACSIEIWDEDLAKIIIPGKTKFTRRKRQLDCLKYIADKYGPNKACSSFIIGLEPAESFLEGAEYLASLGIVPVASIWIPFGKPVMGNMKAPGLEFYRKIKYRLAEIYDKYDIIPPGGKGLNVCMCRDAWINKREILDDKPVNVTTIFL
jgi:hypothetical protein